MSEAIGKTVARVEIGTTDPKYGWEREDTVLIHFTDGTALSVTGSSHEEVSQYAGMIGPEEIRAYARAAQGRRERERQQRLQRAAWMALPCEERGRQRAEREAKMGWLERGMLGWLGDGHGYLLTPSRYRVLCPVCREAACENTETVPATIDVGRMTINIPKLTKPKARRS